MSKRERRFLENMTADLLKLHKRGEVNDLTLQVTKGSVSYSYTKDKAQKGSSNGPSQPSWLFQLLTCFAEIL